MENTRYEENIEASLDPISAIYKRLKELGCEVDPEQKT